MLSIRNVNDMVMVGPTYVRIYEFYVLMCWWDPHALKYMIYIYVFMCSGAHMC
jgi:hypothetical protein